MQNGTLIATLPRSGLLYKDAAGMCFEVCESGAAWGSLKAYRFGVTAALLTGVAVLASALPAQRAVKVAFGSVDETFTGVK